MNSVKSVMYSSVADLTKETLIFCTLKSTHLEFLKTLPRFAKALLSLFPRSKNIFNKERVLCLKRVSFM